MRIILVIFLSHFLLTLNAQKIKYITDFIYDAVEQKPYFKNKEGEKYYYASINGKYGLIDAKGNAVIDFVYDEIKPFSNGLAAARKNCCWGFIDIGGKVVIPFIFDSPRDNPFEEPHPHMAIMSKNCQVGAIDKKGNTVIDFKYGGIFYHGYGYFLVVKRYGEHYGLIDSTGREIVPLMYEDIWVDSINFF